MKKDNTEEERPKRCLTYACFVPFVINLALIAAVLVARLRMSLTTLDVDRCTAWRANSTAGLADLIQQITDEEIQRPQTHYLGWSSSLDPDAVYNSTDTPEEGEQAHLTSPSVCPIHEPTAFYTLCWNASCEGSFCRPPLTYENGRIRVDTSGYYFIYSRLLFDASALDADWMSLTHDILKQMVTYRTPQKLLENRHVLTRPEEDKISSYLGAVFYLFGGESVYARVNADCRRYLVDAESYFGLFRI